MPCIAPSISRLAGKLSEPRSVGKEGWQMTVFSDPKQLTEWPEAGREDDFWLRQDTLGFLFGDDSGITTEAILLEQAQTGRRVLLTAQTFTFEPARQASDVAGVKTSRWNFRKRLLGLLPSKVLVLGQLLTSGDYASDGFAGMSPDEIVRLLEAVTKHLLADRSGYRATVYKDLTRIDQALDHELRARNYHPLPTESVMSMDISSYSCLDDYLKRLSSKYRVRYRRARAKLEGITRRPLCRAEVSTHLPVLYELYRETSGGADFNLTPLTAGYFSWLAEVGDVCAYFNEKEELVGFTTAIANGSVYQAHFLGLRDAYKYSHHLYHNMLFDLLEAGIATGTDLLDFGRTATEIKSSVGAQPVDYATLLKLHSPLLNALVPRFIPAVFEAAPYQLRNPFGK